MVKITLPNPNEYQEGNVEQFLRQLELCVHHARKSYEEIVKNNDTEKIYVSFRFPQINLYNREQDDKCMVKVHVDEETDEMQNVELEISVV